MANGTENETVVDGVHRLPETGIKVIVIGAGVGGLATALECWRKGCEVVVLEQGDTISPLGDYFTIPPSGLATLKYYPSMWADYHKDVYNCTVSVYTPAGKPVAIQYPDWRRPGAKHCAPGADVSLSSDVQSGRRCKSSNSVVVRTATGNEHVGDVCVAANGIGTTIEGFKTAGDVQVQDSGYAVARVAFPLDAIKAGTPAEELLKDDWIAWVFTHRNEGTAAESWGNLQNADEILHHLYKAGKAWDPAVIDFLKQTPTQVVDWNLRWRDGIYQWTSDWGRLIRLGDAAHAFFPTAGNGAVQSIEDAISLAEGLHIAGKENLQWATKVHNRLRFERVSILQQTGFLNREELHTADIAAVEKDPSSTHIGFFKIGRWVWAHDAEQYARVNYADCLASLKDGKPFKNTNIPPGHVYHPWSLDSEKKRMAAGIRSNLKQETKRLLGN